MTTNEALENKRIEHQVENEDTGGEIDLTN